MFDSKIAIYIGFILAVAAIALGVVKPEWSGTAWTIAAILGYGTPAAARKFIDSKGWLTYTIGVVVLVLVILQISNIITMQTFVDLMVAFSPLTGLSYAKAIANSPASKLTTAVNKSP